jgi:hypothetical protein
MAIVHATPSLRPHQPERRWYEPMISRPVVITALVWLALTIVFAVIGAIVMDWRKWHELAKYSIETNGYVMRKEPDNHRIIQYSYAVDQQTYSGLGNASGDTPEFDQLNIGDEVRVFYNPDNPKLSILGNPESQARSIERGVFFLAIFGPLFSMIGLYTKGWLPVSRRRRS